MWPAFSRTPRCGHRGTRPGRTATKKGRRDEANAISVKELALGLGAKAWRTIKWREGTAEWLSSRFARLRVRVALQPPTSEKPSGRVAADRVARGRGRADQILALDPSEEHRLPRSGRSAKLRWRIERDYQELKQEVGLGHYEGRGWRGFHHHATLCIAAYGFLISERETIPPSGPRRATLFPQLAIPDGYRPRGSAIAA